MVDQDDGRNAVLVNLNQDVLLIQRTIMQKSEGQVFVFTGLKQRVVVAAIDGRAEKRRFRTFPGDNSFPTAVRDQASPAGVGVQKIHPRETGRA